MNTVAIKKYLESGGHNATRMRSSIFWRSNAVIKKRLRIRCAPGIAIAERHRSKQVRQNSILFIGKRKMD